MQQLVKTQLVAGQTIKEMVMDDLEWATKVAEILTKLNEELEELETQRGQTVQQKTTEETKQGEKR